MTRPIITMYSKTVCGYCDQARAFFDRHGIDDRYLTEIKLDDEAKKKKIFDTLGLVGDARTVPQILMRDGDDVSHIGGMKELAICGLPSLFMDLSAVQAPVAVSIAVGDVAIEDDGVCEACQ